MRWMVFEQLRGHPHFDVEDSSCQRNVVDEAKWEKYKYHLVIGNAQGWADRLGNTLTKSSLAVLVDGGAHEWYYPLLEDKTQLLRTNATLHSMTSTIEWALLNDAHVRGMVSNANKFAKSVLGVTNMAYYMAQVLEAHVEKLNFMPRKLPGFVEAPPSCNGS